MAVIDDHNDDAGSKPGSSTTTSLPDELSYLITAFLPNDPVDERSKAFLTLSAFCQGVRASTGENSDAATKNLVKALSPPVTSRLAETDITNLLASVSFLTALFQVDWESAASILQQDGVLESITDAVDLTPSGELPRQVAQLFSQASGYKSSRSLLLSDALKWLEAASKDALDISLQATATTALIKLLKGAATDRSEASGGASQQDDDSIQLTVKAELAHAGVMKKIISLQSNPSSVSDAVEGLAYLSVSPDVKDDLSRDGKFLKTLFSLVPSPKPGSTHATSNVTTSTTIFGVLVIVANLCSYRPRLNEEQSQIQKLRQMASSNKKDLPLPSPLDDDNSVKARIKRLIEAGALSIFPPAVRIDSPRIYLAAGNALLGIIEDQTNRGKVLQAGGAKVLTQIMKHAVLNQSSKANQPVTPPSLDPSYLGCVQALAKLAITSSPVQVFGPNEGAIYDAIRPFSLLVGDSSSNLLQKFEAIMALTNVSSQSPELATRVANADGLVNRVELLLLEDHTMVRRAAMELICNLIAGSDDVFERYGGASAKSKLQVVLALSDVDDVQTRLAASGAVATLTTSPAACQNLITLQWERHRAFRVLGRLIDPSVVPPHEEEDGEDPVESGTNPGLAHRAFVTVKNVFTSVSDAVARKKLAKEAEECGLPQAIRNYIQANLIDSSQESIVRLGIEALKSVG